MSDPLALDTSLAVPLAVQRHPQHDRVVAWRGNRPCVLSGHALAETYSVLTRLPAPLRVPPTAVVEMLDLLFDPPVALPGAFAPQLAGLLADAGIEGGAVYDALVALAARENGLVLATRDGRAKQTYDTLGVDVELVA